MPPHARLVATPRARGTRVPRRWTTLVNLLTTPVIYSLALPLIVLDAWTTLYQRACFPLYGIAPVRRRPYFVIDRHRLRYLDAAEKLNCFYCSYATGLLEYVREVTARTEQYWCPIKHARPAASVHGRYRRFIEYGDASGYRRGLLRLRGELGGGPITQEAHHVRARHADSRPRRLQSAR